MLGSSIFREGQDSFQFQPFGVQFKSPSYSEDARLEVTPRFSEKKRTVCVCAATLGWWPE